MERHLEQLAAAEAAWRQRQWPAPSLLVVSGSGLAVELSTSERKVLDRANLGTVVPFELRGVVGHPLEIELLETAKGHIVAYQRGRIHSYQGYDANDTVFMVRLAARLGISTLVMTNAAGGVKQDQMAGDVMVLTDHLNLTGLNPLRGTMPLEWGPQFPDMSDAYNPNLVEVACEQASELGLRHSRGIYAGFAGPSFETPAEVRMARRLGADAVGMSTVLEVIAARHMGVRCLCLSMISNLAAGVTDEPVDHEQVLAENRKSGEALQHLLDRLLERDELYGGG